MPQDKPNRPLTNSTVLLPLCPWCGGTLGFRPEYPVSRMIAGEDDGIDDRGVPPALRSMPAWVCTTPHCRYRAPA